MKKTKILSLTTLTVLIFLNAALSYAENAFLWRVQSRNSTVFLLGSIHVLKKDVYPLSRAIEGAFEEADYVAVEADVTHITLVDAQQLITKAFYAPGDSLDKHISREAMKTLEEETGELGLPTEFLLNQKPWFLALSLESLELLKSGYDPAYGIDAHFLGKAEGRKKILELESLDYQIRLLSGMNDKEQELFLSHTLKNLRSLPQEADEMVQAWKAGDVKGMERSMAKDTLEGNGSNHFYEKLVTERNRNMVSKIEEFLKGKGTYFVIVGAAHLVGEGGIIQLLKGKGYRPEQK